MSRTPLLAWLGLTLLCFATGCSSIPLFSRHKFVEADARHPVSEILCIWKAAEGRGLDNLPARGFGGQILLFANGIQQPVRADGDVRIYVFDEQGVDGDPSKPLHQFDFPAAVWNAFVTPTNLGTTYQIFIPYTRKGSHPASCSLRVRFTPEGGLPVYSKMALVELAGEGPEYSAKRNPQPHNRRIITAAAESEADEGQGIVTSDWSQLISDPQAVADSVKKPTQGIPLGAIQASTHDSRMLSGLRQAVEQASSVTEEDDAPPQLHVAETAGVRLHPLRATSSSASQEEISEEMTAPSDPDSQGSSEYTRRKSKHPLADLESE